MTQPDATLTEQVSLYAYRTPDSTWLERMNSWDEVARLGDTFILNTQVSDQPVPSTRLIPKEALQEAGRWLAGTLHEPFETPEPTGNEPSGALHQDTVMTALGFPANAFPPPYAGWRMSAEVYLVLDRICYLLVNQQFIRYRALTPGDWRQLLSGRVAPFSSLDDSATGTVLAVVGVPSRLAALGGLRGFRRALLEAGTAQAWLRDHLSRSQAVRWEWTTEFYDDALCSVLSLDGTERVPLFLAYQKDVTLEERKEEEDG